MMSQIKTIGPILDTNSPDLCLVFNWSGRIVLDKAYQIDVALDGKNSKMNVCLFLDLNVETLDSTNDIPARLILIEGHPQMNEIYNKKVFLGTIQL